MLLSNGENPKVAAERLGHSTIVLTLDTYSHVLPDMQQQAPERIEQLLFSTGGLKAFYGILTCGTMRFLLREVH
jgi:hypothetical protein